MYRCLECEQEFEDSDLIIIHGSGDYYEQCPYCNSDKIKILPNTPRSFTLVRFCGDMKEYPQVLNRWRVERGPFIFLGEIKNKPGQCIITTKTGKIFSGFPTCIFEEIPESET